LLPAAVCLLAAQALYIITLLFGLLSEWQGRHSASQHHQQWAAIQTHAQQQETSSSRSSSDGSSNLRRDKSCSQGSSLCWVWTQQGNSLDGTWHHLSDKAHL
jgi:hypothetical protein